MKKSRTITIYALGILLTCFGCGKSPEVSQNVTKSVLSGTYQTRGYVESMGDNCVLTFHPNDIVDMEANGIGVQGTYVLNGDQLRMTVKSWGMFFDFTVRGQTLEKKGGGVFIKK